MKGCGEWAVFICILVNAQMKILKKTDDYDKRSKSFSLISKRYQDLTVFVLYIWFGGEEEECGFWD